MPNERELTIEVRGMTRDRCERTVANALKLVPGVEEVLKVSHAGARARVTASPEATPACIESAVAKAGCRARVRAERQVPGAPMVMSRDLTSRFHPYLTLSEGIKLAAQTFDRDVAKLLCCAA